MDPNVLWTQILALLASLGGAAVVGGVVAKWVGDRIAKSLEAHINHQYEVKVEALRSELTAQRERINEVSSQVTSGFLSAHPYMIEAVKSLWEVMLEIDSFSGAYHLHHNILTPSRLESLKEPYVSRAMVRTTEKFNSEIPQIGSSANKIRPFLGEQLWELFFAYRAVSLRMCIKMHYTYDKEKRFYAWYKDEYGKPDELMFKSIAGAVTQQEIQACIDSQNEGLSSLLKLIKSRILSEINAMLLGRRMIDVTLEEIKRRGQIEALLVGQGPA